MRKKIYGLGLIIIGILASLIFGGEVHAALPANVDDQLYQTALYQGVIKCYQEYGSERLYLRNFNETGYLSIFSNSSNTLKNDYSKTKLVQVPTGIGNSVSGSAMTCEQVFTGGNGARGVTSYNTLPSEIDAYGYVFSENEGAEEIPTGSAERRTDEATIKIESITDTTGNNPSNPVKVEGSGIQCSATQKHQNATVLPGSKDKYWWKVDNCVGSIALTYHGQTLLRMTANGTDITYESNYEIDSNGATVLSRVNGASYLSRVLKSDMYNVDANGNKQQNEQGSFATALEGSTFGGTLRWDFKNAAAQVYGGNGEDIDLDISYTPSAAGEGEISENVAVYVPYGSKTKAAEILLGSLGADNSLDNAIVGVYGSNSDSRKTVTPQWKPNDIYALYFKYLKNAQAADTHIGIDCTVTTLSGAKYKVRQDRLTWCVVDLGPDADLIEDKNVSIVDGQSLRAGKLSEALEWLSNPDSYNYVTDYADDISSVTPSETVDENGDVTANVNYCYEAGVEGVSWFVCPTIDNLSNTAGALDGMINNWLEVDSNLYDSDSAVSIAWGIMRNIANTVMIVILLVIIFSQLTGYGIDNYGIKKMLPRLIVMAVIINLSFIICEIAIDLSNLLGNGFDAMFRGIGDTVQTSYLESNPSLGKEIQNFLGNFVGGCLSAIYAIAGVGGAVAPTAITIATAAGAAGAGPMAVIIIVLALLVILVALIIFFLMLGARTIIIITCVTLAPVAFALAVLPNTKSLMKRWWDLFKAALLIFPICGLVEGISYLLKMIAVTTPEVSLSVMVIVFLAPFLPFFLLPTLLRGAIAGLGRVGGALTSMGGVLRNGIRGTQSAVQSTEQYKSTMQEGRLARIRRHRGIGEDGKLTTEGLEKMRKAERKGGASFRSYMNDLAVVDKDKKAKDAARAYAVLAASETEIPNARTGYTDQAGTFHAVDLGKDFGDKTFGTDASGNTIRGGNREAYYANKFLNAAYSGDSEGMTAAISAAKAAGMKDKYLASMIRQTENRGLMNLGENEKRDWLQSARTNFGGVMATDAELGDWAARGGYATLGDYGDYAGGIRDADGNVVQESQMNFNDMNIDDIPKLSGDGLAGAIRGGLVTTAMARDALAQYGSSLSQDKKVMLGMMADGLIANTSGLDARRFKQEADAITRGVRTSSFVGDITNEQVGRWLQKPPQAVRLEGSQADVPIRGERGGNAEPDYQSLDDWNTGGGGGAS